MRSGILSRMDLLARNLTPLVTTFLIVVVAAVPTRLPLLGLVAPSLTLIAVYYWTVYRPDLMGAVLILALGLLQDLLIGGPPGVTPFVLLVVYLAVVSQRRFFSGRSFGLVWWGFMLISTGAATLTWITHVVLTGTLLDPRAAGVGLLLTILLYPPIAYALSQAHRLVPARDAEA
jgi:rod shape-determining protein MreD